MKKRIIITLLAIVAVMLSALTAFAADGTEPIEYDVYENGGWVTKKCTDYKIIQGRNIGDIDWDDDGWYLLDDTNAEWNGDDFEVKGDVHLILSDYAGFAFNCQMIIDGSLSIYRQKSYDRFGSYLRVNCGDHYATNCTAITGDGSLTVYGGRLIALGSDLGAGIGGQVGDDSELDLTVYGGYVCASSTGDGAGIGGGATEGAVVSWWTLGGGDGGNVKIYGGEVEAYSMGNGAGIGGGYSYSVLSDGGNGGNVKIYGGKVTAYSLGGGAGIGGGGNGGDSGTFEYYGGNVHAYSVSGSAVGHGDGGEDEDDYFKIGTAHSFKNINTGAWVGFDPDWNALLHEKDFNICEYDAENDHEMYLSVGEDGVAVTKECIAYEYINRHKTVWGKGQYIADGNATYHLPITVTGDVDLILKNGSELTLDGGIVIQDGCTLTVYAQEPENGKKTGKINILGRGNGHGILGSTVFHGGDITVTAGDGATGIAGDITLLGGNVTVYGGKNAVGIGGGYDSWGGNVRIYGGSLTAYAGEGADRAIGLLRGTSPCTIIVGDDTVLIDRDSKSVIEHNPIKVWNETLDGSYFSFDAVHKTPYLDFNGENGRNETKYSLVHDRIYSSTTYLTGGWYILSGKNITVNDPVTVTGDVHIIIQNGHTLDVIGGIRVTDGGSLSVYAQSDAKNAGKLNVTGTDGVGIVGDLRIYGGKINVTGGKGNAGIAGTGLTILGGRINAVASEEATRAISSDTITVGKYIMLIDGNTDEPVTKENNEEWSDVLTGTDVSVYTAFPETYIEYSADGKTSENKVCLLYNKITANTRTLSGGWYMASGDVTIDHSISVSGDVHLVLADGCKLTVDGGIRVNKDNSLTVYAQSEGNDTGILIANGSDHCAGIGGGWNTDGGNITIHGGNIDATGGNATGTNGMTVPGGGAGIGAGENADGGEITIYGGIVTAHGGNSSAGIGGGYVESQTKMIWSGEVTIYGGTVNAYGGEYNQTEGGAGIGSGYCGIADDVTVNGGKVEAIGGYGAAGIGGGMYGMGCNLTVNDGEVKAYGGIYATGIGGGAYGFNYTEDRYLYFNGGTVIALGYPMKGIGSSFNDNNKMKIVTKDDVVDVVSGGSEDNAVPVTLDYYIKSDDNYVRIRPLAHVHSFTSGIFRDNGNGTHSQKCAICTEYSEEENEHVFTNYKSDNNATCVHDGTKTAKCDLCDVTDTVTDPGTAKGHDFTSGIYVSIANGQHAEKCTRCSTCGNKEAHSFVDCICFWCGEEDSHTDSDGNNVCDVCRRELYTIRDWDVRTETVISKYEKIPEDATVITAETKIIDRDGYYIVNGNVVLEDTLEITACYACIILKDGCSLVAKNGIVVEPDIMMNTLEIYGQSQNSGVLEAFGDTYKAGIHYSDGIYSGSIDINGGTVIVHGGAGSPALCCEDESAAFMVSIFGGSLTAEANHGTSKTGIMATCVYIYGGTVTAKGGNGTMGIGAYVELVGDAEIRAGEEAPGTLKSIYQYICDRDNYIQITAVHNHKFYGEYRDNGDGTHQQKCIGCSEYSAPVRHKFVEGVCVCGAVQSCVHADEDGNGWCDLCSEFIVEEYSGFTADMTTLRGNLLLSGDIQFDSVLIIDGDVVLYLKDGCSLIASHGILLTEGNKLTVNAQSKGDDAGKITAYGDKGAAGIGGDFFTSDAGDITLNGGIIHAEGGMGAAGIGGGFGGNGGNVTINGGIVEAVGGIGNNSKPEAAGIGGGYAGDCGNVTVNSVRKLVSMGGRALGAGLGISVSSAVITVSDDLVIRAGQNEGSVAEVEDITDDEYVIITGKTFVFDAKNLALESVLAFRFKGYLNEYIVSDDAYMEFTVGDIRTVNVSVKDATIDEYGRYVFTCYLNVLEVDEKIRAIFHNGNEAIEREDPLSVSDYLELVAANHTSGTDEDKKVLDLIEAICNYAHYSQAALDETHTEYTVGEDGTYKGTEAKSAVSYMTEDDLEKFEAIKRVKDGYTAVRSTSRSLVLDDKTAIVIYLVPNDTGYVPTVKVTDSNNNNVDVTLEKQDDGRWKIVIPDIAAHMLGDTYTVDIDDGGIVFTDLSALSYAVSVFSNDMSDNYKLSVSAMYAYYKATLAFMNE